MQKNINRKHFQINRYERRIISLIVIIPLLLCVFFTVLVEVFFKELIHLLVMGYTPLVTNHLTHSLFSIIILIWGFFLITYMMARIISNKMLGAFERIFRDIDEMNNSGVKKHLHCRKQDTLTFELVQRLNTFMDKFAK